MAQARARQINGDLTFNADLVYASLFISKSNANLAYDSTAGWSPMGALSVASDQSFSVGMESEEVITGMPETVKDDLLRRLTGEASLLITDINPLSGKWAMGTTADIVWDTSGTTWSGTVTGTTSTKAVIYVSTATGANVGDVIRFTFGSGNAQYYYPGIVDAVDTTANTLTLKYALPEIPAESSVIDRVRGYTLFHGGNVLQNISTLIQLDFPKGDQHNMHIFKGSANGGFTRQFNGPVRTPFQMKMYGVLKDIGSLTDQVTCAATYVGFPNR